VVHRKVSVDVDASWGGYGSRGLEVGTTGERNGVKAVDTLVLDSDLDLDYGVGQIGVVDLTSLLMSYG